MRRYGLRSVSFALVVSAVAFASPAYGTLPEFLPTTFPVSMTGKSSEALFEEQNKNAWLYKAGSISGEITGNKTLGNITLVFSEGRNGCDTGGTLTWSGLVGRIGYVSKSSVGLALESPTQPFAECDFLGIAGKAYGGALVGEITPLNKSTTEFTLTYTQLRGEQSLSKLEGETAFPLVKGACEYEFKEKPFEMKCIGLKSTTRVAIATSVKIKTAKAVEIRA